MITRREQGFTLIEVIVAFAIFALSIGAIFEIFHQAVRTSERVRERNLAWLTAQSLLSELRIQDAPWPYEQRGVSGQVRWWIDVQPYPMEIAKSSPWNAYQVEVHVVPLHASAPAVELDSVELARQRQ
jgi:general secretion pathway protein I